ncbi:MAG: repair protein RecO protein [Candidatus Roizmanbacteria bacterium GW2011_GWA2_36_23]|uniref:Repair protein RecO protein n=1 Tax=Candidatus Roizmanbacteria bacterium GW2011_GWA2_36_23 TaxID=1618480 RepID=A0A0G0E9K8_9BACT|nr:MAG: repair protein RecO protein [Candidatus Roizmanbacteria bacterium GW2011_GWA2_36_23]
MTSSRQTIKSEAIVLRKRNLPNQDLIINLFTKDKGRLTVFAKGIKKITSRRLSHSQTGNLVNAVIYKRNDYSYLQETNLVSAFSQIKTNKQKTNCLYFMLFVLDRLLPENEKEEQIYDIVKRFLIELSNSKENNRQFINRYLNKIMMVLGYLHEIKPLEQLTYLIEGIINEKLPEI